MRLLVALETHFVQDPATGRVHSRFGFDAAPFWGRYLEVFDEVLVAARTAREPAGDLPLVDGPGIEVAALPDYHGPWEFLRVRAALQAALARAVERADVLCLRAPGPIAGLAWTVRGNRPVGIEVVGDPYDALAPGAVKSPVRPLARAVLARDLRAMCRGADGVAYVTMSALQRRYPTKGWATSYSSIALDEEAFRLPVAIAAKAERLARKARMRGGGPWQLVTVGSLAQPYKGHEVLLDALARLRSTGPACELTVVGDGRLRDPLTARAQALGIDPIVRFVGQVPPGAAVRALLDEADVFVLPSWSEGLPRALIEALARGMPAVATAVGGVPELLPRTQLVPTGDAAALATRLAAICSEGADFATIGQQARLVAERYRSAALRKRRNAFYGHLRAAAEARGEPQRREGA
jgi:glycosyltransferase involved in cell wall biosynthesis